MTKAQADEMPVTLIYFMEMLEDTIPVGFLDKFDEILDAQDEVINDHIEKRATPSNITHQRGLVFLQQVDSPRVVLGSGQWPSAEVCRNWFGSPSGLQFVADCTPFSNPEGSDTFLLDGIVFPDAAEDEPALFNSDYFEVTQWQVLIENKDQFSSAVDTLQKQQLKCDPQRSIFGAWREEDWRPRPNADTTKEYFMISSLAENKPRSGHLSDEEALCDKLCVSVQRRNFKKAIE